MTDVSGHVRWPRATWRAPKRLVARPLFEGFSTGLGGREGETGSKTEAASGGGAVSLAFRKRG